MAFFLPLAGPRSFKSGASRVECCVVASLVFVWVWVWVCLYSLRRFAPHRRGRLDDGQLRPQHQHVSVPPAAGARALVGRKERHFWESLRRHADTQEAVDGANHQNRQAATRREDHQSVCSRVCGLTRVLGTHTVSRRPKHCLVLHADGLETRRPPSVFYVRGAKKGAGLLPRRLLLKAQFVLNLNSIYPKQYTRPRVKLCIPACRRSKGLLLRLKVSSEWGLSAPTARSNLAPGGNVVTASCG